MIKQLKSFLNGFNPQITAFGLLSFETCGKTKKTKQTKLSKNHVFTQ